MQRRTWSTVLLQPTSVRPLEATTLMFAHHAMAAEGCIEAYVVFGLLKIMFAGSGCCSWLFQLTFTSVWPDRQIGDPHT